MSLRLSQTLSIFNSVVVLGGVYLAWKAYNNVNGAIDSVIDPLADKLFSYDDDEYVQLTELTPKHFWRDDFDENWVLNDEKFNLYSEAYPHDMLTFFNEFRQLKIKYRSKINA